MTLAWFGSHLQTALYSSTDFRQLRTITASKYLGSPLFSHVQINSVTGSNFAKGFAQLP
jgi:hypothetical protein